MKQLVLCEGKADVELVSSFLQATDGTLNIWPFYAEEIDTSFRNQQRQAIQNFDRPWNDHDVLVKSENGKRNLAKVLARRVGMLVDIDPAITVLVDLDGGALDDHLGGYEERIRKRHAGPGLSLGDYSVVNSNADMLAATCEVLTRTERVKGTFDLLAFRQRPENVVGIGDSSSVETDDLVDRLLARDHVIDLLRTALLDTD